MKIQIFKGRDNDKQQVDLVLQHSVHVWDPQVVILITFIMIYVCYD